MGKALEHGVENQKKGMLKMKRKKQAEEEGTKVDLNRQDALCRSLWIDHCG